MKIQIQNPVLSNGNKEFTKGNLYQGKVTGTLYLCINMTLKYTENTTLLIDTKTGEIMFPTLPAKYIDVTNQYSIQEVKNET